MVARRGNAPRSAGCEPAALLLSYRAIKEVAPAEAAEGNSGVWWAGEPVMLRGLRLLPLCSERSTFATMHLRAAHSWLRTKYAAIAPCGQTTGGAPRTRTLDTCEGATVFKTASSTSRTRSVCEMAPPLGIAPSSHRLTGGPHTLCVERNCSRQELHLRRSV
jgi:hypothetical protein